MDTALDDGLVKFSTSSPSKSGFESELPVSHALVDFSRFLPLNAKIDCIKLRVRRDDLEAGKLNEIRRGIRTGSLEVHRDKKICDLYGGPSITVHDPSFRDLQYLVERFWDMKILYIEFAVDARLPPGSNDLHLLKELKTQLRHCLYPQAHDRLPKANRKYFNLELRRYRNDGLGSSLQDGQVIWEQASVDDQLALYIKEMDQNKKVRQPWVRIEARLEGSGPFKAGLDRVGMLPQFADNLRTYLSPMFSVAKGFKNADELIKHPGTPRDPWSKWGAQWTANGFAQLEADANAKNKIGSALNDLRRSLIRLTPPSAVAHRYRDWVEEMLL